MTAALQLYLVRHGETAWSLTGQHTGRTEVPLTANGEAMARRLEPVLRGIDFSLVLTSPRLRAQTTCALAGLAGSGTTGAQSDANLAEWDYGDYEGLRTVDIHKTRPSWDMWTDGCPGGEAPDEVAARADALITRLAGLAGNVALFSHGHVGRVLAARWIGLPVREGQHFGMDVASLSILGFEKGHPERRVISLWNASAQGLERQP